MDDVWLVGVKLLAALLLVLCNAFFVAAEFSLVSIRRTRVEELLEEGKAGARAVKHAVDNLDHSIAATQLGITLASLGLGWLGEPTIGHLLEEVFGTRVPGGHTVAVIIAFALITSLHIVIGELTPKSIALQYPERTSLVISVPLAAFDLVFRPFVRVLNATGQAMLGLLGLRAQPGHHLVHSSDELKMLVEASGRAGVLEESERAIINRAFDFADFTAREVMVPRTEVIAIPAGTLLPEIMRIAGESGFSRYPVYEGSLDQIIGVLHVKDVLRAFHGGAIERLTAKDMARRALEAPETLVVDELLNRMREASIRMAVLIDEYGGTAGIVTMENLVERLFGPLRDEFEQPALPDVERHDDGTTSVSGLTRITDINELLNLALDDSEYDTIGGYVFGELGRVPALGDAIRVNGLSFSVEAMDGRRVDRLLIAPNEGEDDSDLTHASPVSHSG